MNLGGDDNYRRDTGSGLSRLIFDIARDHANALRAEAVKLGIIIAEFDSELDAHAFRRVKGEEGFTVTHGVTRPWAVRKVRYV